MIEYKNIILKETERTLPYKSTPKTIGYETSGSDRWYLAPKNRDAGSIHSDMMFPMEWTPILPADAHIPAGLKQFIHGLAMIFTPLCTIQKKHISSLRL